MISTINQVSSSVLHHRRLTDHVRVKGRVVDLADVKTVIYHSGRVI